MRECIGIRILPECDGLELRAVDDRDKAVAGCIGDLVKREDQFSGTARLDRKAGRGLERLCRCGAGGLFVGIEGELAVAQRRDAEGERITLGADFIVLELAGGFVGVEADRGLIGRLPAGGDHRDDLVTGGAVHFSEGEGEDAGAGVPDLEAVRRREALDCDGLALDRRGVVFEGAAPCGDLEGEG